MNQKSNTYFFTGALIVLAIGLVLALGFNARNKKNLRAEKNTTGVLTGEKEKALEEIRKLNDDYAALSARSDENARLLEECKANMSSLGNSINALSRDNKSLKNSSIELAELRKKYDALEKEQAQLNSEKQMLLEKNTGLHNDLASVTEEKEQISAELHKARLYDADNFLVTATRGKKVERVVIFASRARKLNMAFEIPRDLTETISFRITTPEGTVINPDDKGIAWFFPPETESFVASLSSVTGEFEQSRQVVLNYTAGGRLVKGDYKIEILSNRQNIGNCRIRLK